jgi:hypothetical protein
MNKKVFTLSGLVNELQIEAFKSDVSFQALQDKAWKEFEQQKHQSSLLKQEAMQGGEDSAGGSIPAENYFSLHKGFTPQELLSVYQYKFDFDLSPHREGLLKRIWRALGFLPPLPGNLYELYDPSRHSGPVLKISVIISRTPLKNYVSKIDVQESNSFIKPEDLHVSGIIK